MSNEPDPTFSSESNRMAPPGIYYWPPGFGGSTKDNLVGKYIPYPHVPGHTPPEQDPGLLDSENPDK